MIEEKENALFEEWAGEYEAEGRGFVKDGVVSETDYLASDLRLCFVLKEANDPNGGGWDLRKFLHDGGRPNAWHTLNNLARWAKGVRERRGDLAWTDFARVDQAFRQKHLRSICAVNLGKEPGGPSTPPGSLNAKVEKDKGFLRRQFEIYKPHLTVCCGDDVSQGYKSVVGIDPKGWQQTSRGIWWHEDADGTKIIGYWHPAWGAVPDLMLFYTLIDAVRELFP